MAVDVHGSISSCVHVKNINYMEDKIKTHTSCSAMSLITKFKISLASQTPLTVLRWRGLARETSSKSDSEHLKVHDCFL